MKYILTFLAVVSLATGLVEAQTAKKKPKPSGGVLSLSARSWQDPLQTNIRLSNNSAGALTFTFPGPTNTVNYIITSGSVPRVPSGTISATLAIDASFGAQFAAYDGCPNPTWRILVMAHGTNWSSEDARWWSNPASAYVQGGVAIVSAPVDPALWSNVNGQYGSSRPAEFASAFYDVSHYGITFGACFFGHGVFMQSGSASARLTDYRIQ